MKDFRSVEPTAVDHVVDRLLKGLKKEDKDMRTVIEAAAIVRWFNKGVLRNLLPDKKIDDEVYNDLLCFPFVYPHDGYNPTKVKKVP